MTLSHDDTDGSRIRYPLPPPASPAEPEQDIRSLMGGCPVARGELPDGSPAWLLAGFEEIRQAMADPRFSRALAVAPGRELHGIEMFAAGSIIGMDAPGHTRLRKLAASAFTLRRAEALRPRVAAIAGELIDALAGRPQPADLVAGLALPLPVRVICEMLGVPAADTDQFRAWSDTILGDWARGADNILAALASAYEYLERLIAAKRASPADDLLSGLIAARDEEDRLSEAELTTLACTLLFGGYETTANQISLSVLELLRHPDELARLRSDPELIPGAVEELMRYVSIGGGPPLARVTTQQVQLGGVTIPAGEAVLPMFSVGNHDPAVFRDPDRLDVSRPVASHLGFGAGSHYCLGAPLARVELQEVLRVLTGRLPGLTLGAAVSDLRFRPGKAIYTLRELPVRWDTGLT